MHKIAKVCRLVSRNESQYPDFFNRLVSYRHRLVVEAFLPTNDFNDEVELRLWFSITIVEVGHPDGPAVVATCG